MPSGGVIDTVQAKMFALGTAGIKKAPEIPGQFKRAGSNKASI